ncbi:MAG: hypothetical protein ACLVGR_02075 [Anaerovoracaceae bacterium]
MSGHYGSQVPELGDSSIGPTILYPHSPDERVNIASVAETWKFLVAVLENIPEK